MLKTIILIVSLAHSALAQVTTGGPETFRANDSITISDELALPELKKGEQLIRHFAYSLVYNETHEQASWIAYQLTKPETVKSFERTDNFIPDPLILSGSASNADYKNSGYDRGHLAPASDMGWSSVAMAESFLFSNMSPQNPSFNRGIWKKLEMQVRSWAIDYDSVYVVTGPVLTKGLPSIGPARVSVPRYYYKVIVNYTANRSTGIAFILPNRSSSALLQQYVVSIDSVESLTAINFFPSVPDSVENEMEKNICTACWNWDNNAIDSENMLESKKNSPDLPKQCSAITQTGTRCRRMTKNSTGKCYQH